MSELAGLQPAPDVIDGVLTAAGSAGCIVLVEDRFEADVRFATNTITTNGVRRSRRVTVIAIDERDGGAAPGVTSATGAVDPRSLFAAAIAGDVASDSDALATVMSAARSD